MPQTDLSSFDPLLLSLIIVLSFIFFNFLQLFITLTFTNKYVLSIISRIVGDETLFC